MRRKTIRLIMLFTALLSVFFLVGIFSGCEKLVSVTSVEMKEGQQEITVEVGKFEFSDYTVVINYDDGTSTEEELKEEYIPTEYQMLLYSEGTHEILVKAHMRECSFTLNVLRHSFSEEIVLNDVTAPYSGEPYSACVEGVLPSGAKITYSNGNSFTNVGSYECYAILTCEGYVTKYLQCVVTITPVDYDMSGVCFEDEYVYDYDGKNKTVTVKGELPKGVTVSYTINGINGNGAVNANSYTVIANFHSNDPNYNPIEPISTTLKINKKVISTEEIGEEFKTLVEGGVEYNGKSHGIVYKKQLPTGVSSAIIEYYASNGEKVTEMINAGEYTVKINLTSTDEENHALSCYSYSEKFVIRKQLIISNNIYFDNKEVFYNGTPHTITVTGEHIDGLSIIYEVEGQTKTEFTDVGTYNFKATIPEDSNYEFEEVVREATLTVLPIKSGYGDITDSKIKREVYTGEEFGFDFSFIPDCLRYEYILKDSNGETVEHPVNVGYYTYTVSFLNIKNYNDVPDSCEYYLEITNATMVIPDIYFKEVAFEYTGEEKEYPATTPSEDISVSVEYVGRDSLPLEIGSYDVSLTFSRENYATVVKTAKLIINNAIIYDNINLNDYYSGIINASVPYNDGNPIDFSEYENKIFSAKRITRNDEKPEGLYYYGVNGADIPVKVNLEYYKKGSNEPIENIYEVGEYEINFVYSFVNPSETGYVKYDGEKVKFTVTKADITLVDGVDYTLGEYISLKGTVEQRNWSEVRNSNPSIKISEFLNENIGSKGSKKEIVYNNDYYAINSDGETLAKPVEVGLYTLVLNFQSEHYNVTAETTWEIRHVDLDKFTLYVYFDNPTDWYVYGKNDYAIPNRMIIGGIETSSMHFNPETGIFTTESYSNRDITITYKIYWSRLCGSYRGGYYGSWERNSDGTLKEYYKTNDSEVGVGAFYFVFTVTNGAGEQKVFYGDLPNEENSIKRNTVTSTKYCAVRIESQYEDVD